MTTTRSIGAAGLAALLLAGTALGARAADGLATGDTSGKSIAFSNSYAGDSFRQVMIKSFDEMGAEAVKDHRIKATTVVSANDSVTEQA